MKMRVLLTLTALTLLLCGSASATPLLFYSDLTGEGVNAPVMTPARGFSTLWLDDETNTIRVSMLSDGLTSPQTAAQITGPAMPGQVGQIFATLPLGNFTDQQFTITSDQAGMIKNRQAFVSISTTANPAGEIRGQYVAAVPEPGTLALVASGVGLALFYRRRRR